jgi:hypothetical protein
VFLLGFSHLHASLALVRKRSEVRQIVPVQYNNDRTLDR